MYNWLRAPIYNPVEINLPLGMAILQRSIKWLLTFYNTEISLTYFYFFNSEKLFADQIQ